MSRFTLFFALSMMVPACSTVETPTADAAESQKAPDFSLTDLGGTTHRLADQKGKIVVLEWYNPDCPFVVQAHGEDGALRTLGDQWTSKGIVWWAINSGASGKQGTGIERNQSSKAEYAFNYPVLLDEPGTVGRLYDAKTTPHMVIIDASGHVAYDGALSNAPFGDAGGEPFVNHVDNALTSLLDGNAVKTRKTKPWGCGVKY